MIKRSFTRVTLALDIVRKIEDGIYRGYHELAIIKHQIDLFDTISIENAPSIKIRCNNPLVPTDQNNICWKAVELIQKQFGIDKAVHIDIEKCIPVMGGLAGGSTNAATVLGILNHLWELNLSRERLMELGRCLGMDVPFYFMGGTAFDTETTGELVVLPTNLTVTFILALPDFGVSTKDAYQNIEYPVINKNNFRTARMRQSLMEDNIESVISDIHNDFELSVFPRYPQLKQLKDDLIKAGCIQAVMSGSGSTVIGIVPDRLAAEKIQQRIDCKTIIASSKDPVSL